MVKEPKREGNLSRTAPRQWATKALLVMLHLCFQARSKPTPVPAATRAAAAAAATENLATMKLNDKMKVAVVAAYTHTHERARTSAHAKQAGSVWVADAIAQWSAVEKRAKLVHMLLLPSLCPMLVHYKPIRSWQT